MRIRSRFLMVHLLVGSIWIGVESSGQTGGQFPNILRKKAVVSQSVLASARAEISVSITGLLPGDVINLRPSDDPEVSCAAGTVMRRMICDRVEVNVSGLIRPGEDLPQACLKVTATQVVFARPHSVEGCAFLDIKIPAAAQVFLKLDSKQILSAVLLKPVSYCDGEWGSGAEGVAGTLMRATGLLGYQGPEPVFNKNTGFYTVSNSKVRITGRTSLDGRSGLTALVLVSVDETGRVTKATPLTASEIMNLSDTLLKWSFKPYVVNGRAIPFETCIPVSVL